MSWAYRHAGKRYRNRSAGMGGLRCPDRTLRRTLVLGVFADNFSRTVRLQRLQIEVPLCVDLPVSLTGPFRHGHRTAGAVGRSAILQFANGRPRRVCRAGDVGGTRLPDQCREQQCRLHCVASLCGSPLRRNGDGNHDGVRPLQRHFPSSGQRHSRRLLLRDIPMSWA